MLLCIYYCGWNLFCVLMCWCGLLRPFCCWYLGLNKNWLRHNDAQVVSSRSDMMCQMSLAIVDSVGLCALVSVSLVDGQIKNNIVFIVCIINYYPKGSYGANSKPENQACGCSISIFEQSEAFGCGRKMSWSAEVKHGWDQVTASGLVDGSFLWVRLGSEFLDIRTKPYHEKLPSACLTA